MQRLTLAAALAALVTTAAIGTTTAQDRPEGGLNGERGITEASTPSGGPEASGKVTFTDVIVTGHPQPDGND
jgi:hypothetical protein